MVASLRSTLLTVAARFLRFDVVRMRGGEFLEPADQPPRDEHQQEGDDQDGGDTRPRLDPVHRVEPLHDLFFVIHHPLRDARLFGTRKLAQIAPSRACGTFLQAPPARSERQRSRREFMLMA